jgi:hypothetical protein
MFCDCKRLKRELSYLESKVEQIQAKLSAQGLVTYETGMCRYETSNLRYDIRSILDHLGLEFVNNPAERVLVKKEGGL